MTVLLALDQGTTSSRALVIDAQGRVLASAQRELTLSCPRPGWVEQDPLEIWETQRQTAAEALRLAGLSPVSVTALGITNQRETTIVWERATSRPIAPAIVWQDRRTAELCEQLRRDGHEPLVRARTGLLLDPYFSATKIRWILRSVPGALDRARSGELAFGTVDAWLVWMLTGGRLHVTDATNASRTMLYDIGRGDWDDQLLELLDVPRELLPDVVDSSGVLGETDSAVFGATMPIAGIAGDQQAALFGQACTAPGMAKVTYGTGCFLLLHAGDRPPSSESLLGTVALQQGGRRSYALEGSVFTGGAAVQWLRDGLGLLQEAAAVNVLAESAPDAGGVVFVPALTGLGAPHWDPHARGAILGITRGTTAAHVARATLEGIAFQVADLLGAAAESGLRPQEIRADGGGAASDVLLQTQASLLGIPVVRAAQPEATALGVALLAGLAVGLLTDADVTRLWRAGRRFEPDPAVDRQALLANWRRAVAAVRGFAASGPASADAEAAAGVPSHGAQDTNVT
jgi:glycerol kinase